MATAVQRKQADARRGRENAGGLGDVAPEAVLEDERPPRRAPLIQVSEGKAAAFEGGYQRPVSPAAPAPPKAAPTSFSRRKARLPATSSSARPCRTRGPA